MRRMNAAADFSPRSIIPGATAFTAISGASAFRHDFGQHVQRRLRRTIMRVCRPRPQPAQRPHIDDLGFDFSPPWLLPRLRRIHFRASRDTRNGPRVFDANIASHCRTVRLLKLRRFIVGRIVDQDVDAPQFAPRSFIIDLTLASSVTSQCSANARTPNPERSTTVSCASRAECVEGDGHIRARPRQRQRRSPSQTPRRAGDEAGLAAQRFVLGSDHCGILLLNREGDFVRRTTEFFFLARRCSRDGTIAACQAPAKS
jgi:hypothetical protein